MQGLDGGKRTASLLKRAVEEELKSSTPTTAPHLQVAIRVYANVKGLAKTYEDMEILSSLDEFIRGFNMGDVMCDYIDAGNGKECSDEKVKGKPHNAARTSINANLAKRISDSICKTSTASRFFSVVPLIMDTLVYSDRSLMTRQHVGGSLYLRVPLSPTNWPISKTDSVRLRSKIFLGAKSWSTTNAECRSTPPLRPPLWWTMPRLLQRPLQHQHQP